MSELLEQAIVDATALKEAALKNAENTVLEKYSGEVKNAPASRPWIALLLERSRWLMKMRRSRARAPRN